MFKNYIKLTVRNLWKNKIFSSINIAGLSLGMAVCIVILLFVGYEKSFDSFHTKNIYRLDEVQTWEGMVAPQKVALSMYPMGYTLKNDFPEIKNYTRISLFNMSGLTYKNKKVFFKTMLWTEASFFQIFDFKLLKGDRNTALKMPNSVVLTRESAAKLFGTEDPMGKSVVPQNFRDTVPYLVTGIMEDVPKNSHLQFDGLYSFSNRIKAEEANSWGQNWVITYLQLTDNTSIKKLEAQFPAYLKKYIGDEGNKNYKLFLQPLKEVHDNSTDITHDYINFQKFDKNYTYLFFIIALIVLTIGCINFVNLSTAHSSQRSKEVGIRKTIGAHRFQLAVQFMGESVLLSLLAMVVAILVVKLFLPYINSLSEHNLEFSLIRNPGLLFFLFSGTLLVGVFSGIYPAFYLSSFKPVKVLKGLSVTGNNKSIGRNALVVGQFASAAFLIIATIFVVKQLNYMRNKDAGFNKEQVVTIPGAFYTHYDKLKAVLEANTLIKGVTASTQRLGNNLHQGGFVFKGDGPERELDLSNISVDPDFLTLYNIKLIAGKNFTKEGEGKEFIINESLAKELLKDSHGSSYESLIGKLFGNGMDSLSTIVGISKDFNFNSFHHKIETLCMYNSRGRNFNDLSVKIDAAKTQEAIRLIQSEWQKIIPDFPFSYQFLDEQFDHLYEADKKVSKVVGLLSTLAILIACLGLVGLSFHSTERRVKEIGIRKVLGASVLNIVSLLSKDFIKLVLVANLIAWPIAAYALTKWLENYAYRIDITWPVFVLGGIGSLLIALIAVSSQTVKAAVSNPVKSLRIE